MVSTKSVMRNVLSKQFRRGTKVQRQALEKFIQQPKFAQRKPTAEELQAEFLRKESPLYGIVKTKVKDAASAYWRSEAQYIARHIDWVRVDIKTKKYIGKPIKAFISVKTEAGGRVPEKNYVHARNITKDPNLKKDVMKQAYQDLLAWVARYERYSQFFKVFGPVLNACEALKSFSK